jgi:hypothetical protein
MAETGHVKNVENLKKARDFAVSWGSKYAPSNPNLSINNINTLITDAEEAINEVHINKTPYRNATATCEEAFAPLSRLVTRIVKTLKASGISDSIIEDAQTYSRKIQGRRKIVKKDNENSTTTANEAHTTYSVSQMSRTQRIENLDALHLLIDAQEFYKPNEKELKVSSIEALSTELKAKTQEVGTTFISFSNSLNTRDTILYDNEVNVVAIGKLFKIYVEAAFGRNSNEWNQVRHLVFKDNSRK